MKKEELDNVIKKLESSVSVEDAYLELYHFERHSINAKANKKGLILYAIEFLKSAIILEDSNEEEFIFDKDDIFNDGNLFIENIIPTNNQGEIAEENSFDNSIADKLVPFGCLMVVILLLASTVVGFFTIIEWLF